jgi:hypothetical protein
VNAGGLVQQDPDLSDRFDRPLDVLPAGDQRDVRGAGLQIREREFGDRLSLDPPIRGLCATVFPSEAEI